MKIYLLPVDQKLQPPSQIFQYPHHNEDYGVEQDFHRYLLDHKELTVAKPESADWHYLPVYWTRRHLNHYYGQRGLGILKEEIDKIILDDSKTFTICQYDDGPLLNLGSTTEFLASRKSKEGIDIPLLSTPHQIPLVKPAKLYLASFLGRFSHEIRQQMAQMLKGREDIYIYDGDQGTQVFVEKMLASYVSLCPRGYGGSSFRFFEAMQLGVVPFLVGDLDTRPFKNFIHWDEISFFTNSVTELAALLDAVPPAILLEMGEKARCLWENNLTYQKWCSYVLKELACL